VAVNVKEVAPLVLVGVPVIQPVAGSKLKPAGKGGLTVTTIVASPVNVVGQIFTGVP
jgi:hypothetical protein